MQETDRSTLDCCLRRRARSSLLPNAPPRGPASRSSTRRRIRARCSRPGPPAAARSTTPCPSWTQARQEPSPEWKIRYALMLGLERVLSEKPPHLKSGTELRRHQVDALAGMLTELIAAAQRQPEAVADEAEDEYDEEEDENGENGDNGETTPCTSPSRSSTPADELSPQNDPGRHPPLPLPASDRVGEDDRRRRFRRSRTHDRRPDPHPPAAAGHPVQPRAEGRGLRRPDHARDHRQERAARSAIRSRSRPTPGSRATSRS